MERGAGRPRSERATKAILDAAPGRLYERGFAGVTIDAVAGRACFSKATIYKRWPNKAAGVLDSFLASVLPVSPVPDVGDLRRELVEMVRAQLRLYRDTAVGVSF